MSRAARAKPEQTKYRYANQDIDQTRTHLNYAIFARDDPAAFVQSKIDEVDVKPKDRLGRGSM